ncbi:hypothetical protein M1116_01465 [Patescibacteria group bacterium]|nr:hypothetical protein [Patescibacteria group bacterium]
MEGWQLLASPWWVNLLILIPVVLWFAWKNGLQLSRNQLLFSAIFAIAFGVTEAVVVVYLRNLSLAGSQAEVLARQGRVMGIEVVREACTIVMLAAVAINSAKGNRERWALFLYSFALWDLMYYACLKTIIGWPSSLLTEDVLFLIPVSWTSQVWFPVLVSVLTVVVVLWRSRRLR